MQVATCKCYFDLLSHILYHLYFLTCLSWCIFCFCWWLSTVISGLIRSKHDFNLVFMRCSEGKTCVVEFSVIWTALSGNPFEVGCYGAEIMWLILFLLQNCLNISIVKHVALSLTNVSGIPCVLNDCQRCSMVVLAVDVVDVKASIHFE